MTGYQKCRLCPRECGIDRRERPGRCGVRDLPKIARAALHYWEEPVISGSNGSGAVFFSGCGLRCVFCQNAKINTGEYGKEVTPERLMEIFLSLQEQGAHNLNLVTPTAFIPTIAQLLKERPSSWRLPVVYNTGGYEKTDSLKMLDGLIDIYLPDIKFYDRELCVRYLNAEDYFDVCTDAVEEMYRQTGPARIEDGLIKKGVVIRHLVMPGMKQDSIRILDWIASRPFKDDILISLMSQFIPTENCKKYPEIDRKLTTLEYQYVVEYARSLGLNGFTQDRASATHDRVPLFDLTGI